MRSTGQWPSLWLLVFLMAPCPVPAESVEEYTAKAALAFHFARYTDWPEVPGAAMPEALRVCVVGEKTLVEAFQRIGGRRVGDRHIQVEALRRGDEPGNCQLIYIDSRDRRSISPLLASVRDLPILTIGEIPGFTDYGGIINLYRSGDKLRFEVSLKAAKRANLAISSRLLRLARVLE